MLDDDGTATRPTRVLVNDGARNTGYKDWASEAYEQYRYLSNMGVYYSSADEAAIAFSKKQIS